MMGKPVILLSSVTYAMKGRDLLLRQGLRAYVEPPEQYLRLRLWVICAPGRGGGTADTQRKRDKDIGPP